MLNPSDQLHADLLDSVAQSLHSRRPLLHHLNADSSWLLQIPKPLHEQGDRGRYYNILIDPWLSGSQSDVANWFSQQWHASVSSVPSIEAVEALIREIEALSREVDVETKQPGLQRRQARRRRQVRDEEAEGSGGIDMVAISHEFTDHCHKATLLELPPTTPIVASTKAAQLVNSWQYFDTVMETPVFTGEGSDWRSKRLDVLPDWLSITRVVDSQDMLYYHSAVLVAFQPCADASQPSSPASSRSSQPVEEKPVAEAVIYTPHGIHAPSLAPVAKADPPIRTLALMHGLHDIALPTQQLNLGAHNAVAGQRMLNAKYWIGTHDEVKRGGGFVSWFLRRKVISVEEALRQEKLKRAGDNAADISEEGSDETLDPSCAELGNGESMLLA